jgi:hypothetical protein
MKSFTMKDSHEERFLVERILVKEGFVKNLIQRLEVIHTLLFIVGLVVVIASLIYLLFFV